MGSECQITGAGAPTARTSAGAEKRGMSRKAANVFALDPLAQTERTFAARQDNLMTQAFWTTPGFGPMTRISTSFGDVPAQVLRERDLVRVHSGELLPIVWVDRIVLSEDFLTRHPDALPIELQAGVFGQGQPGQAIQLSPSQVVSPDPESGPSVRQKVRDLLDRAGASRKEENIFTYTRFHLGQPAYVCAEGLWIHICPDVQQGRAA